MRRLKVRKGGREGREGGRERTCGPMRGQHCLCHHLSHKRVMSLLPFSDPSPKSRFVDYFQGTNRFFLGVVLVLPHRRTTTTTTTSRVFS